MTSQPLISVLLPVFNGGRFLIDYLARLQRQSYENWELVVIDNASSDSTAEVLREAARADSRIKVHRNPSTVSVIENHNVAVSKMSSQARYCKILHVDDAMEDDALARMVLVAERYPHVGMVVSWACQGDEIHGKVEPLAAEQFSGRDIGRRTLSEEIYPFLSPSCLLLRSDLGRDRGRLYQIEDLHADIDSTLALLAKSDFAIVQAPLIHIRDHAGSVTQVSAKPLNTLISANYQMLLKHGPQFFSAEELATLVSHRRDRYLKFLARSKIQGRGLEFWSFHQDVHAASATPLVSSELLLGVARQIVTRPVWTFWALRDRWRSAQRTQQVG